MADAHPMTQADMEELREAAVPLAKLRPDTGERAWQQIDALFDHHGITHIPGKLRDELVVMLLWARYGERLLTTHDAYRARIEELEKDRARLDWLETMTVNVRVPLVHGSRDLFWASPDGNRDDDEAPSDIRSKIDQARLTRKDEDHG